MFLPKKVWWDFLVSPGRARLTHSRRQGVSDTTTRPTCREKWHFVMGGGTKRSPDWL